MPIANATVPTPTRPPRRNAERRRRRTSIVVRATRTLMPRAAEAHHDPVTRPGPETGTDVETRPDRGREETEREEPDPDGEVIRRGQEREDDVGDDVRSRRR